MYILNNLIVVEYYNVGMGIFEFNLMVYDCVFGFILIVYIKVSYNWGVI